jgi:hypothetical protein
MLKEFNNYLPNESGLLDNPLTIRINDFNDFRQPKGWEVNNTHGLISYEKISHDFLWVRSHRVTIEYKTHLIPIWEQSSYYRPFANSKLLTDFLSLYEGVTDIYGTVAKEDLIAFTEEYGCMIAFPDDLGGIYTADSVPMTYEHWQNCKKVYDLYKSGENSREMREMLNEMMRENPLGIYATKQTGEALFIHDDPSYSDEERKMAKPPLEKDGRQGGIIQHKDNPKSITGIQVSSLRGCITLMLHDLITGYLNIIYCIECGGGYLSQKKGKKSQNNYCSKTCGSRYRAREFRNNKKGKN